MSIPITRYFLCWAMVLTVPLSLLGQTPSAILHTQGGVWVNGYEANDSSAVFAGDLLETKTGFAASLTLDGTTITIQPESVAKFQDDALLLDHGSVSVATSKGYKVKVNCITVVPVANEWTQYDVTDVNASVQVAARKLDVRVEHEMKLKKPTPESEASSGGVVHESEQKSYDEHAVCGAPPEPSQPGHGINPKWIAAGAGGIGILILILVHGGGGNKPVISPSAP
jgi:ribosomal 50S subunit-recycling heat shock protein